MKYVITGLLFTLSGIALNFDMHSNPVQTEHNKLTPQEEDQGWELLFDGKSTDQWRGYNASSFPERGWSVQDEELVFEPFDRDGEEGSQNIITKEKYEDFHLKLDWKIEAQSNSGILYGILEQEDQAIFWSGLEYQIIDTDYFDEIDEGIEKRLSGALYDLVPAQPQNTRPVGEWNQTEIIVDGSKIIHRQNDEMILEIERWTPEWFEMIRNSKFECHNEFANIRKGHIGIQDHGGVVKLRDIKVKVLD